MPISAADCVRFQPASDQSLLIYFGQQITLDFHQHVTKLLRLLECEPIAGIRNLHPGYCSLLVVFDGLKLGHDELEVILREYLERLKGAPLPQPRQMEIPVCYGEDYGPDLHDVAEMHGLTVAQAIELHASAIYVVYFLGFVPGFAYLGDVSKSLAAPSKAAP
jgi:inhibitor of KinA